MRAEDYSLVYNEAESMLAISGILRLNNFHEYEEIKDILIHYYEKSSDLFTIDLTGLKYLNSAGLTTLNRFILHASSSNKAGLRVIGNSKISWQKISLIYLKELWDQVDLVM